MGNRSYLYLVSADAEDHRVQFAEANNNFPSLWQILLAGGEAAEAITDQRVFGDAGTDNLAADAEEALARVRSLADVLGRHPLLDQQPLLPLQFEALLAHLRASIDAVRAAPGEAVRLSADLDQLSWLDEDGTPAAFLHQCQCKCDQRWARVRAAMHSGDYAALDEALGLKAYGRDFSHWEAWAWEFGFAGIEHDYFNQQDEPRAQPFADFVPEPRSWHDDLSDGYRRFQRGERWGVRWRDPDTGREREVLAPEWEEVRYATDGGVWLVRDGLHGYARLDPEQVQLCIAPELDEVWPFHHDADEGNPHCAIVRRGEQFGLLAHDGHWLLPPSVDDVWGYGHGFAPFRVGEREGFLGADGSVAIAAEYESVSSFSPAGVAAVWRDDRAGLVNGAGEFVLPPTYDDLEWKSDYRAFLITQAGKVGLCRADGSVWLAPEWEELKVLLKGVQIGVRRGERWGMCDWQGRERIAPCYDTIESRYFDDLDHDDPALARLTPWHTLLIVRAGKQVGVVDHEGQVRVPITYEAIESFETEGTVGRVQSDGNQRIRVVQRGARRVKLRGVFDMEQQREIVAPEWNQVHLVPRGAEETVFLVSRDVPKADRDRLGDARMGVLRADGSVLFAPEYAWIGARWALGGDGWGAAIVRDAFEKAWGKGEPVQALRNEDWLFVWLHADGRIESHAEYLSRCYEQTQDLKSAWILGRALRDGDGVKQDLAQARHWLWIATGADLVPADAAKPSVWRKLIGSLVDGDRAAGATPGPSESARPRDVHAMHALALMLQHGEGGPEQPETARAWLEFALTHGGAENGAVLGELGYLVCEGIGGPVDLPRGQALYERAIEHDSKIALHNLAIAYQYGTGVEPDLDRALGYFRRAERLGDAGCAYHVGHVLAAQAAALKGAARRKRLSEALYALSPLIDSDAEHCDYACGEYARICLDRDAKEYDPAKAEEVLLRGARRDHLWCIELLIDEVYGKPESGRADAEQAAYWTARKAELEAAAG